jgi:hypothetical protein
MKHRVRQSGKQGAALVVTLIVVVALATVLVAFMQNTTMERSSSRSGANYYRAELAAESGLAEAMVRISEGTKSDDFIILKAEAEVAGVRSPVYYAGMPGQDSWRYFPLFSGGLEQDGLQAGVMPDPTSAFSEDVLLTDSISIPANITDGGVNPVRAAWADIKDASGKVVSRYVYWVEDLGGYLDADLAGAKPLERDTGDSPEELGIFTLFRPDELTDSNPADGPDRKLIDARVSKPPGLKTLAMTRSTLAFLGLGSGISAEGDYEAADDFQQYFATGLRYPQERAVVPRGLGYVKAGQPKKNLNSLIKQGGDSAVDEIAGWISDNLPQFDQRKGGFPASQNYAKTLAANIIDYADTDNEATVGEQFRGVDSYPFLTQIFTQIIWVNNLGGPEQPYYQAGGTWHTKVRVNYHLQLWNPSNKSVDSGVLALDLSADGNNKGENTAMFFDGSEVEPLFPFPGAAPNLSVDFGASPLPANGYQAFSFGPIEYDIDTGINATFPAPGSAHSGSARFRFGTKGRGPLETSDEHGYRILWNGKLVDQPGAVTQGMSASFERQPGRHYKSPSSGGEGPAWRGGQPGLRHGYRAGVFETEQSIPLLGDPRGSYYVREKVAADRYDQNASWWGRHYIDPQSTSGVKDWFVSEARLASWPDGAHHDASDRAFSLATVTPVGDGNPALRAKRTFVPADVPAGSRVSQPQKAPTRISNAGELFSLTELGNIYDPIQWSPNWDGGNETTASAETKWAALGSDPADPDGMVSDPDYVVPSTLRIGRGEFAKFDQPGQRAYQLLDIFTLAESVPTEGLVNINTASRDVLRALGAGINIASDPAIEPAVLRPDKLRGPFKEKQADLFADAVINGRPFMTTAQLSSVKMVKDGREIYFFGNPEAWDGDGPSTWTDSASEEYFSKMLGLVSVRSRNFRVYVTGDALDKNGEVASRSRWEYQVSVEPVRGADGQIEGQKMVVISAKSL